MNEYVVQHRIDNEGEAVWNVLLLPEILVACIKGPQAFLAAVAACKELNEGLEIPEAVDYHDEHAWAGETIQPKVMGDDQPPQ